MASRSSTDILLAVTIALTFISAVQAGYRKCGIWDCYVPVCPEYTPTEYALTDDTAQTGSGVYCCGDLYDSCCYTYYIYSYWWFWSIWALGIAVIIGVVYCCRRRRRAANAGIIVQHAQPVYGTSSATTYAYTGPAQSNYNPYANQPTAAPPSAPAYQEKPPAYMP